MVLLNLLLQIISFIFSIFKSKNRKNPSKINSEGFNIIASFEGAVLHSYKDLVGVLTIGYGHTGPDVLPNQKITQKDAFSLLMKDLSIFESGVFALVKTQITRNQFSALVSFSYNLGLESLKSSTLLKLVNSKKFDLAALEFQKWDHAGGKKVEGLLRRRDAESKLFSTPGNGTPLK